MANIKCFLVEPTTITKHRVITDSETGEKLGETEDTMWRRTDTGEIKLLKEFEAGAMWFADWYDDMFVPQLAHVLVVKTPGGDWICDSQSSNCTMPDDFKQIDHHCWIIERTVPNITVSKNGKTCGAGAGSIQIGEYHGFLRNGVLEDC